MPSETQERMTQSSSAIRLWLGNQSEIHRPLSPCCFHVLLDSRRGEFTSPMAVTGRSKLSGRGLPASLLSSGFGSKRSRWLGPPSMKRNITFFALPQLWGIFGRVGLFEARASSGSLTRADNATAPKPAPAELRK